jgi:hypothetical protein
VTTEKILSQIQYNSCPNDAVISNVYQTVHNKPQIYTGHRDNLHTLTRNHTKLHICLRYTYYLNNPINIIHTSQTATTSTEPTQTGDFSEAEESTDSDDDDDDDWLYWQAVTGRGKKRTRPRTTNLPKMKEN